MSAGGLRERVAEVIREHAPDEGDCICSEYVLDIPHAAHLADAVLAVVRAWLASNEVREVVARTRRAEERNASMSFHDWGEWEEAHEAERGAYLDLAATQLAALIDQTKED